MDLYLLVGKWEDEYVWDVPKFLLIEGEPEFTGEDLPRLNPDGQLDTEGQLCDRLWAVPVVLNGEPVEKAYEKVLLIGEANQSWSIQAWYVLEQMRAKRMDWPVFVKGQVEPVGKLSEYLS